MIQSLSREYPSRYGVPVLRRVDAEIFERRAFGACMECGHCGDSCCFYGVDVDLLNVGRILQDADRITAFTGIRSEDFFLTQTTKDAEFPGGGFVRTNTVNGRCIFLDTGPGRRGCRLHAYCLQNGIDYHERKPMVSSLFPVTFDDGLLHAMDEVIDGSLACLGNGPTLYRSTREELQYYFGSALIEELDALERSFLSLAE
ncbi:MAG TPA: hypothetical protein VIV61_11930 [Candidatus Ozemobacteraceae bacterium]